nr:MAG TPA: retinal maintenance-like protein [Bacteriophage sp.]
MRVSFLLPSLDHLQYLHTGLLHGACQCSWRSLYFFLQYLV